MPIDIQGTDILLSELERMMPTDMDADGALEGGAQVVEEEMIRLAPVGESGNLKDAIKAGKPKGSVKKGRTIDVGIRRKDIKLKDGEYYPAFVEYGHGGPRPAPPHPFIRPAWDAKKDEAYNKMKQAVIDKMNSL